MLLSEIAKRVEGIDVAPGSSGADRSKIDTITIDSREVEPGALFAALPGTRADGHDFVESAVDNGARGVLVERERLEEVETTVPVLTAVDTRQVLGSLADEFYGHPSEKLGVTGITGTNGKTTTAHLVGSIVRAAGREVGIVGTVGVEWGEHGESTPNTTPESLEIQKLLERMRADGVEEVVMEVSSHGLATHRMRGTALDRGVLTNLTRDHLDFHGDMKAYRRAKGSLFRRCLPRAARRGLSPMAILNVDDDFGRQLADELAGRTESGRSIDVLTYSGRGRTADVTVEAVDRRLEGTTLLVQAGEKEYRIETPLLGEFNDENCAAAAAVARTMGVELADIAEGLAETRGVPGRMERVEAGPGQPSVFVDYAHTPNAIGRLLETLAPLAPARLVVIFGCGGDRDREKRPLMGVAATSNADVAVVTSDNPRTEDPVEIIDEILEGISREASDKLATIGDHDQGVWVEPERGRAIGETLRYARSDDVVVIAGKGHESYQEIGRRKRPFDDRARAETALERRE